MTTTADGVSSKLVQPAIYRGAVTPTSADIGDLWEDTSTSPPTLKQCTAAPNTFAAVSSSVAITGGTIDGATIGATTPSTGTFTTLTAQTETIKGTGNNFLLQSSSLTTSPWALVSATSTGSQADPFGGTTATLINDGTGASTQHYLAQGFSALSANTYTYSVYAKSGTSNYIGIYSTAPSQGAFFNLTTGAFSANIIGAPNSYTITDAGSGWWRIGIRVTITANSSFWLMMSEDGTNYTFTGTSKTVYVAAPQVEVGSTLNTYISTTSAAIYGTPSLSFNGVSTISLDQSGNLSLQPAGTGALQAQATTSSTVGGNARGANAVDWQTLRSAATHVASGGPAATLGGGQSNTVSGGSATVAGGQFNNSSNFAATIVGGNSNNAQGAYSAIVGGAVNTSSGYYNFIGAGFTNSGTSGSAVTTQSGTMNATTAVTLSGSNASIKVGQFITGTSISNNTYVAAISGTSLTLSQNASGSSTSTLSFYTPHGVVVGGGNNQATGSYSFIGGGGDAGTAANRNVASGAWSFIGGGRNNTASGAGAFLGGGGYYEGLGATNNGNSAVGDVSVVGGGILNQAPGFASSVLGGQGNYGNNSFGVILGNYGSGRGVNGNIVFSANVSSLATYTSGNSQSALLVLAKQTTDATSTVLVSNTSAASGTNQVILPNNSAYYFRGEVIAGVTGAGNTKGWYIEGVIKRGANAASTAIVGTATVTSLYADAGAATWALTATADTTNGGLAITFTGQASTTIRVVCQLRTTEMTY